MSGHTELRAARTDHADHKKWVDERISMLTDAELERAERYIREDDRIRCITGRLLIRELAAEHLGDPFAEISVTSSGKPYFAKAKDLHFNISHSGSIVILAVSSSSVGVDVEKTEPIEWEDIAEMFNASEKKMLCDAPDKLSCFLRIWTAREALSKQIGTGLSIFERIQPQTDYEKGIVFFNGSQLFIHSADISGHIITACTMDPERPSLRFIHDKESCTWSI